MMVVGPEAKVTRLPDTRNGGPLPSRPLVEVPHPLRDVLCIWTGCALHNSTGVPSTQATVDTGLPGVVCAAARIPLTSGPQPRSSLNIPAQGHLQPLCSDSGSRSAASPAQQPPLPDPRRLPAAGGPTSISVPRPALLDRGAIPQPLLLPLSYQGGQGPPSPAPSPLPESSLVELQCCRHWGQPEGGSRTPALATAPPSRAVSQGRLGLLLSVWPRRRVLSPKAALLAGRALPQRLERNVPLRKPTRTRKGKGAAPCTTGCSAAHLPPRPLSVTPGSGVPERPGLRGARAVWSGGASGLGADRRGSKGRRAARKTPGWGQCGGFGAHTSGRNAEASSRPEVKGCGTRPEGGHVTGRRPRARKRKCGVGRRLGPGAW